MPVGVEPFPGIRRAPPNQAAAPIRIILTISNGKARRLFLIACAQTQSGRRYTRTTSFTHLPVPRK